MSEDDTKPLYRRVGDRIAELRKRRGLTQEEAAERSGMTARALSSIENGGSARLTTYHAIARALDVETVYFVPRSSAMPEPGGCSSNSGGRQLMLAEWRSAITPGLGMKTLTDEPPDMERLKRSIDTVAIAYSENRYDFVHQTVPLVVRAATFHVEALSDGAKREAHRLRADALHVAGWYLTQLRENDLATIAIREAYRDALTAGDQQLAAIIVNSETRIMQRQARFREIEELCVALANSLQPNRSEATLDELSACGRTLLRAAAAAARNNRPKEAQEYLSAATRMAAGVDRDQMAVGRLSFGPLSVGIFGPELALMAGKPDVALDLAEKLPVSGNIEAISAACWQQHLLYVASAYSATGEAERATEILHSLKLKAPEWLRNQKLASEVVRNLLNTRKRTYLDTQRELADFLSVEV